jgi:universal stress protein A
LVGTPGASVLLVRARNTDAPADGGEAMSTLSIRNILVATDLEPESKALLAYAFSLGEKLGAKVHLLHAYPPVVVPDGYGAGNIPYEALHQRSREALEQEASPFASSPAMGICAVDLGDALTVIMEMTTTLSVDLIVVGTHGRKGLQRLLLGSIAEAVLREAPVPVLIFKNAEPARAARMKPILEERVAT